MSGTKDLEKQMEKIRNFIEERKEKAIELDLPRKAKRIAETLGAYSNWGGGEYNYHEKGLSIHYSYYNQKYVKVDLGYQTRDVLRAEIILQNRADQINLYIPGDWEKRIDELDKKAFEKQDDDQIQYLQKEITKLKKEWQLEENP